MTTRTLAAATVALATLTLVPHARADINACALKVIGSLRLVSSPDQCRAWEVPVQLSSPAEASPLPDVLPIPQLYFVPGPAPTGDAARIVTAFGPQVVVRATLNEGDSRTHVSVNVRHSHPLDPRYAYDGFYVCLGFSPTVPDTGLVRMIVEHSPQARLSSTDPVIVTRDFASATKTVGDFRAGTPSQGTTAGCLTIRFAEMTTTPSFYGQIGEAIAPPGLFSLSLSTPAMLADKGTAFSDDTMVIAGYGLTVTGRAPTP
ncbi:MAG TPA: hypothetical protein VMW48_05850 [Vicinamibacterales bacterium]|nr:hypothetical protein [Vicinamibacterales bacterium]